MINPLRFIEKYQPPFLNSRDKGEILGKALNRNSSPPNSINSSIQSWASLPDRIKQQAPPEMLAGAVWSYYGRPVKRPSDAVLTRLLPPPVYPARRINAEKRRNVLGALIGGAVRDFLSFCVGDSDSAQG